MVRTRSSSPTRRRSDRGTQKTQKDAINPQKKSRQAQPQSRERTGRSRSRTRDRESRDLTGGLDISAFLWFLKLGVPLNLYLAWMVYPLVQIDRHVVVPALVLFFVSAYRCALPNSYTLHSVLHPTILSSNLVTRVLATFSEIAYIYQFSLVLRLVNNGVSRYSNRVAFVDVLSYVMVVQVCVSQCFVWTAIMTKRQIFFYYEEVGWFIIFLANTVASARLYVADVPPHHATLLQLSLFFGLVYLPWQTLHVHSIVTRAATAPLQPVVSVACNLRSALFDYHVTTEGEKWGGVIGVMWMAAYWALLVPPWLYYTTVTLV